MSCCVNDLFREYEALKEREKELTEPDRERLERLRRYLLGEQKLEGGRCGCKR